jgi:hypothetical protein
MKIINDLLTDLRFLKEQRNTGRFTIGDKHESDDLSTIINRNIKKFENFLSDERKSVRKHEQTKEVCDYYQATNGSKDNSCKNCGHSVPFLANWLAAASYY